MADDPTVPEGYTALAWATYPTLFGVWKPSKVHLSKNGYSPLCGVRMARSAKLAKFSADFRDHIRDAGQCKRCLNAAGKDTR